MRKRLHVYIPSDLGFYIPMLTALKDSKLAYRALHDKFVIDHMHYRRTPRLVHQQARTPYCSFFLRTLILTRLGSARCRRILTEDPTRGYESLIIHTNWGNKFSLLHFYSQVSFLVTAGRFGFRGI